MRGHKAERTYNLLHECLTFVVASWVGDEIDASISMAASVMLSPSNGGSSADRSRGGEECGKEDVGREVKGDKT